MNTSAITYAHVSVKKTFHLYVQSSSFFMDEFDSTTMRFTLKQTMKIKGGQKIKIKPKK
jgi:hypothetical protein